MFIDCSKDRIVVYTGLEKIVIPFFEVEKYFTNLLIEQYKKNPFSLLYCIHGPGTFTNMRVAVLSIQTLNYFAWWWIQYMLIDKFSLYSKLYLQWLLSRYGIVTIGQRRRVALFDSRDCSYTVLLYSDALVRCFDHNDELLSGDNFFVDDCYGEDFIDLQSFPCVISFLYESGDIYFVSIWSKNNISDCFVCSDSIEPFYLA